MYFCIYSLHKMIKKFTLYISFLFSFCLSFAQAYKPIDTADYLKRKQFLDQYKLINEQYAKGLKEKYPGNSGKEMYKDYLEFEQKFRKEIKNKDYVFNSAFTENLQNYLNTLKSKNKNVPDNIKILVAKENAPNAFCVQDGVFIINMGLFNWLDNEDQLLAILSHELGHKILNHSELWQKKIIDENTIKKDEVYAIKSSKTNKADKALELFKKQVYQTSSFRRKNESQADSIGYTIYRNASVNKTEYINALKNLQKYDTISPTVVKVETYKKYFDLPNAPFKEKWLKMEDFSAYDYAKYNEKLNKDSISTHPEIVERIKKLQRIFPEISKEIPATRSENKDFLSLKKIAEYEILPNYYHSEDYGVGIYAAIQFLQNNEDEEYNKKWLGKNFQKIYEARKNYNLNRYLDRVDPKNQSASYQQFLNFMWNLSLEDLKNIADYYNKKSS